MCAGAGINNARMVKQRLDQEHVSTTDVLAGDNKMRETAIINEAGLYDVILDSRKPFARSPMVSVLQAKGFRRWVKHIRGLKLHLQRMCHRLEALTFRERCWLCLRWLKYHVVM